MEVIVGSAGNELFLHWLDYMKEQITEKPNAQKTNFWYNAKMRYVFQTTGPYSMNRFLKLPWLSAKIEKMKILECSHFNETDSLTAEQKRFFDVLSYRSQSYFTKEHEIRVPVGCGTKQLPTLPTTKRMRTKMCVRLMGISQSSHQPEHTNVTRNQESENERGDDAASNPIKETLDKEDRDRIDELRQWLRIHRNSVSVKTILEDMTEQLRLWVQKGPRKD